MTTTPAQIRYRSRQIGDVDVFYREAGPADAPVILLLHGFPTASHMFRDLMPLLADRYRLIAPDLPGFGQTKAPPRGTFTYTFDRLADVLDGSLRSSARTAMPTPTGSATSGDRGRPIGVTGVTPTAKPAALRYPPTRSGTGNTAPEPIPSVLRPMDTNSTSLTWRGPTQRKSSST